MPALSTAAEPTRQLRSGLRSWSNWWPIESGQLPLDQLLGGYQRGAELLEFCRDRLQAVEDQIKVLEDGT